MKILKNFSRGLRNKNLKELDIILELLSHQKSQVKSLKDVIESNSSSNKDLHTNLEQEFQHHTEKVLSEISNWNTIEESMVRTINHYQNEKLSIKKFLTLFVAVIEYIFSIRSFNKLKKETDSIHEKIKHHQKSGRHLSSKKVVFPPSLFWIRLVAFLHSRKNVNEVFEPISADWDDEYFEALFKKEIWKARWISMRYVYAFLAAMWMKSPIGDLIEFIRKFAK